MIFGELVYWDGKETYSPDLFTREEVYHAISLMNGADISGVDIWLESGAVMHVGGGGEGGFICQVYLPAEAIANWLNSKHGNPKEKFEIADNDLAAKVPGTYVLRMDELRVAVDYFCENGGMTPELVWVNKHADDFFPWD
jgi:hypothetical protein